MVEPPIGFLPGFGPLILQLLAEVFTHRGCASSCPGLCASSPATILALLSLPRSIRHSSDSTRAITLSGPESQVISAGLQAPFRQRVDQTGPACGEWTAQDPRQTKSGRTPSLCGHGRPGARRALRVETSSRLRARSAENVCWLLRSGRHPPNRVQVRMAIMLGHLLAATVRPSKATAAGLVLGNRLIQSNECLTTISRRISKTRLCASAPISRRKCASAWCKRQSESSRRKTTDSASGRSLRDSAGLLASHHACR
jgi:hypothetical protein